jgi:haloalkane dehalogenase
MNRRDFLATTVATTALWAGTGAIASNTAMPFQKSNMTILGHQMAYVDEGTGRPVVFLHGNPTSSYLWRNIIPFVTHGHRAIAPDLIGMGDSSKPDLDYTYTDHAAHLHGFLDALDLKDAVLVLHDWGSALGFDWAAKNPNRVSAIAFMEAIVPPAMPFPSLEAMGPFEELFRNLRTAGVGEQMVLQDNFFIEFILRELGVAKRLSDDVMAHYRAPYPTPESRKPLLQWPREIPIAQSPKPAFDAVTGYIPWLVSSDIPKLLLHVEPGALIPPQAVDWLKANMTNLDTVFLGPGAHFIQEDYPDQIGTALADWLTRV